MVNSHQNGLRKFTGDLEQLDDEAVASYFILSVWTRAGMQCEGHFKLPDGYIINTAELVAYPIMLAKFYDIVKAFYKKGLKTEGNALYIWIHTLRGFLYGEQLAQDLDRMWLRIMSSQKISTNTLRR